MSHKNNAIDKAVKYRMSTTRPYTLIPYLTTYVIYYFYNWKTRCDQKKNLLYFWNKHKKYVD